VVASDEEDFGGLQHYSSTKALARSAQILVLKFGGIRTSTVNLRGSGAIGIGSQAKVNKVLDQSGGAMVVAAAGRESSVGG
jgi:hypothetical protein